ncbi:MAG: type IV pilus twitching motility protein PilT [Longibaculum sp.]
MEARKILEEAVTKQASDVFIIAGSPCALKIDGKIQKYNDVNLTPHDTEHFIREIYAIAGKDDIDHFLKTGDDDFSFSISEVGRFRVNVYQQRNSLAAVLRIVRFELPDPTRMHIPSQIIQLARLMKGLVLVTGPAGSGKSTTLACIIDEINRSRQSHIITIEDPIEYLHTHNKSIVSQREVYHDTESYVTALRAALREAPEVILVGEMRDLETIDIAITAAETGHLVFSSLHTIGAANTIDRMIDVFPSSQQQQIKVQLAMVLNAVISQQLIPSLDGKMIPVFEIMICTPAIRNLIREGKTHQIDNAIASSKDQGMVNMDDSLLELFQNHQISKETALLYATHPAVLEKKLI